MFQEIEASHMRARALLVFIHVAKRAIHREASEPANEN